MPLEALGDDDAASVSVPEHGSKVLHVSLVLLPGSRSQAEQALAVGTCAVRAGMAALMTAPAGVAGCNNRHEQLASSTAGGAVELEASRTPSAPSVIVRTLVLPLFKAVRSSASLACGSPTTGMLAVVILLMRWEVQAEGSGPSKGGEMEVLGASSLSFAVTGVASVPDRTRPAKLT
mmetsp:Transcript_71073/g.132947  ORF Transcript_71073/g.132947 Transcript_71073/m.132947 type:complete len:177 (+) Transcript_71073:523-1053(+)